MLLCPSCHERPKQKHLNSKWCRPCAMDRRRRPRSTLTERQKAWVRARIGKMPVGEMATRLGTSVANVKRAFRGKSLWFQNGKLKNNPKLVKQVLDYYSAHGWHETEKRFPRLRIKSIIHRADYYGFKLKPRQVRWTGAQIVEAAKMAGLVSPAQQAKIFNRPRAHAGSIKSLWSKRFKLAPTDIHGMANWKATHIVTAHCPRLKLRHANICLWCDMEKHMRHGVPKFIADGIRTMAQFQRWLYSSNQPKREMLKYLRANGGRVNEKV